MLELGRTRQRKTLRFREWIETLPEDFELGRYLITAFLNPSKYPSGGLIFSLSPSESVKLSINGERYKELMKSLKFKKGRDRLKVRFYFVVEKDEAGFVYGVDEEVGEDKEGYIVQSWGWKYTQNAEAEEEEIDF